MNKRRLVWMLQLVRLCVWNSMQVRISYRSLSQKWNFISHDKISSKQYPKWHAYTCPSKYWVVWNAAEMKLHVNRTYFHAGLKWVHFASYVNVLCSESKIVDIWVIPAISNPFQVKKKLKFTKFLLKVKSKLYSH